LVLVDGGDDGDDDDDDDDDDNGDDDNNLASSQTLDNDSSRNSCNGVMICFIVNLISLVWYGVASGLSLVDVLVIVVLEEGLEGLFDGVDVDGDNVDRDSDDGVFDGLGFNLFIRLYSKSLAVSQISLLRLSQATLLPPSLPPPPPPPTPSPTSQQ
jgi:hypothetical protein